MTMRKALIIIFLIGLLIIAGFCFSALIWAQPLHLAVMIILVMLSGICIGGFLGLLSLAIYYRL